MDVADIAGTGRYVIHEASPDLFTDTETASLGDYSDAVIVVFARSGSESSDVPRAYDESYLQDVDIKGYTGTVHSSRLDSDDDLGRHYLELTSNEEALLEYASQHFGRVIVLINSGKWLRTSGITAGIPVAAPLHHMDERLMHPEDRGTRWRRVMQAD